MSDSMFTVEGAPHHHIHPPSNLLLEAYLDGNNVPLKDYLRQHLALSSGTYIVWVDTLAVRDYMGQPSEGEDAVPVICRLVIDKPSYWYEEDSNVQ